ncbi:hypothetical protein [Nocardiopsis potens]|uniref:hypothetical protein n=1 Tax=Nocardiopsis potens TaxID=1246458 RepID=UPI000346F9B2|nr:hypothetical protein [Nocardiopsis potens]
MPDPFRIDTSPEPAPAPAPAGGGVLDALLTAVLWAVAAAGVAGNVVCSAIGAHPLIGACFGAPALIAIIALTVRAVRRRRR